MGRIVSLDFDHFVFFTCTGLIQERRGNFSYFQLVYLTGHFSFDGFSRQFGIGVFLVENQSTVVSGLFVHGEISCGFFKRGFSVMNVSQHGVQMLDCFLPFFIGDTGTKQDVTYVYFVSLAVDVLKNMETEFCFHDFRYSAGFQAECCFCECRGQCAFGLVT